VPVGTWVKDGSRLKELGASGIYVDKFRNSTYPVINFDGYVIDNCSSRMLNFSGTTEKHPEV